MKISLVSDLHLEFGYQELPGGEVLILAGDIAESRSISKQHHSTKLIQDTPNDSYRCSEFFKWECAKYDKVFYVMGNHEHYHGKFWKTYDELKSIIPGNVTLLENECEEYKGVLFVGATLWTDMNKGDPITLHSMQNYMNDYRVITYKYPQYDTYHKMRPEDTVRMHKQSRHYIEETVRAHTDRPVVVITHMAPTHLSINEKYKHEPVSNGAYVSDLSNLILDNPNIKTWVHGHVHDPVDYMVGDTRVLCNPRGYIGLEDISQFRADLTFEIDT